MTDQDQPGPSGAQEKRNDDTPATSSEIAALLKQLTASVDKLTSKAEENPPAKRVRFAEDAEDSDDDGQEATSKPDQLRTFMTSDETKAFLEATFRLPRPVDNKTRKAWLAQVGLPVGDETKCPKLDSIIKNELPKDALEADKKLSRLQNFVLDAAGPLAAAYDALMSEEEPDPDKIAQHIQLSLRILGNTSTQFSHERRVKAISRLNPDLRSLVEDEDFSGAAPFLFGSGFEKKAMERTEAVKCLRKATNYAPKKGDHSSTKRFFRGARSQWRGGRGSGNSYREKTRNFKNTNPPPKNGMERRPGQ